MKEFKLLFPEGSQGGKASELIWADKETFDLFNDNFIKDIESIDDNIENEDNILLTENINNMVSNYRTYHKKFCN